MNKYWLYVVIAGIMEIFWVTGLKYSESWWEWLIVIAFISFSFFLLLKACAMLPTGTVYAVFTGIGTIGTVLTEMLFFHEPVNVYKLLLVALLLTGIIGLKKVTHAAGDARGRHQEKHQV